MTDGLERWSMHRILAALAAAVMAAVMVVCSPPASADPLPPNCERVPIFGINPYIREICDTPIQPDGRWTRLRSLTYPQHSGINCGWGVQCVIPQSQSPVEAYALTADTIPPGEPGHLG